MGVFRLSGQVFNTIHLGLAFFVLFSADFTITTLQKLINVSISQDNPDYHVDGYVSLGLIYLFYAIFLLAAPSIIAFTGPRVAMTLASVMMTIFFFLFSFENTWLTYLGVFMTGSGGSILWVGQGNYLILNSDPDSVSVHFSIFWATFTLSMMTGNLYATVAFTGKSRIDTDTRHQLVYVATAVGAVSVAMMALLRPPQGEIQKLPTPKDTPIVALKRTFSLLFSRNFMILLTTFIFTGFQQSFGWGIYASAIGFTNNFGILATQLASISAIIYGAGDSLGSAIHIFAPRFGYVWPRRYVYCTGYALQVMSYVGVFLNIPDQAVFGYTDESSILSTPQVWIVVLTNFALGVSDGFINTQIYPLLANMHPEHSAQTSALFKFMKSMSVAAFFFASTVLSLRIQLSLLLLLGLLGSICFTIIDIKVERAFSNDINIDAVS